MSNGFNVHGVNLDEQQIKAQKARKEANALKRVINQEISQERLTSWMESDAAELNYNLIRKQSETIEKRSKFETQEEVQEGRQEINKENTEKVAKQYQEKNSELNSKVLLAISSNINKTDDGTDVLRKILDTYPDHSLADDALDFIIETTPKGSSLLKQLLETKEKFNAEYGREIRAGKNMTEQAREFSSSLGKNPTELRNLYRNIITNQINPQNLFEDLTMKFNYSQMKNVISFILHSLGADLKAKGPSIPRGELNKLMNDGQILQGFLGLFLFFKSRFPMIQNQFNKENLAIPFRLNFELLAKQLMKILQEKYPSPDKVIQLSFVLGISEELAAQIIIFMQYRDALRNISPKLFQSEKHRQNLLETFIDTIEELEDMLEEDDEDEEEEDEE